MVSPVIPVIAKLLRPAVRFRVPFLTAHFLYVDFVSKVIDLLLFLIPRVGDFLGIVANSASALLARDFEQAAKRDVPDLKTVSLVVPAQGQQLPDSRRSDHAAFWQFGYPALMLTDTANFRNPHYHRPTDTLETLDICFIRRVVQAVSAMATSL